LEGNGSGLNEVISRSLHAGSEETEQSRRVDKVKNRAKSERQVIVGGGGGRTSISLLPGSLVSPSRPSDKGSVEVRTLGWLEAVA
jgi:hypothetical protein